MLDAVRYDSWYDSPLGKACFERENQLLAKDVALEGPESILEVGCGTGRFLLSVMKKSSNVIGVDRDISFLQFAKKREENMGIHLSLIQADAAELPFRQGQFNIVYEMTTLCFVKDKRKALHEMIRVCSDNGKMLLGELNPFSPWQWWRKLKGWLGRGSFKEVQWQWSSHLKRILKEEGLQGISVRRAVFFPPLNVENYAHWRDFFEWAASMFWPWIGAFYLLSAVKKE